MELVTYLLVTSIERARVIGELTTRNAARLICSWSLKPDESLRAKVEMALLRG
jgi:hypothetical protein